MSPIWAQSGVENSAILVFFPNSVYKRQSSPVYSRPHRPFWTTVSEQQNICEIFDNQRKYEGYIAKLKVSGAPVGELLLLASVLEHLQAHC